MSDKRYDIFRREIRTGDWVLRINGGGGGISISFGIIVGRTRHKMRLLTSKFLPPTIVYHHNMIICNDLPNKNKDILKIAKDTYNVEQNTDMLQIETKPNDQIKQDDLEGLL